MSQRASIGRIVTRSVVVTPQMTRDFAELCGDSNPLHLDTDYAKTTPFGRPIVHGAMLTAFISAAIATELPGPGAIYLSQSSRFAAPVFVGDTVTIELKTLDAPEGSRRLTLQTRVFDSSGTLCIDGTATVIEPRPCASGLSVPPPSEDKG